MDDRRSLLRRKIDIFRACLREGVEISTAANYLLELVEAERELRHSGARRGQEVC